MNTRNTTPPHVANLPFNYTEFQKIISKMSVEDVFKISIEVWSEVEGKPVEILRSRLSDTELAAASKNATRMIFRSDSRERLYSIGVGVA